MNALPIETLRCCALQEALANANDREAAARDADEASRAAVVATLEEEVDTLSQELIRVKVRPCLRVSAMLLHAKAQKLW